MDRQYLVELRTQRNETQHDVALNIGITRQYYSLIEGGNRQQNMDIMLVSLLANHFNVPVADLIKKEQEWNATLKETALKGG